jgi:hypothetical protein
VPPAVDPPAVPPAAEPPAVEPPAVPPAVEPPAVPPAVEPPAVPPAVEPPAVPPAVPPPAFAGVHAPDMQAKPTGHATHMLPREPQEFVAFPITHWPAAQQPLAHVVESQRVTGGEQDVETAADRPIRADSPNQRRVEVTWVAPGRSERRACSLGTRRSNVTRT